MALEYFIALEQPEHLLFLTLDMTAPPFFMGQRIVGRTIDVCEMDNTSHANRKRYSCKESMTEERAYI